jgi:hypothetical protein
MLSNVEIHGFLAGGNNSKYVYFQSLLHSRAPPCDFYCERYCSGTWGQISFHKIKWTPSGEEHKIGGNSFFTTCYATTLTCLVTKISKMFSVGAIMLTCCSTTAISTNKSLRKTVLEFLKNLWGLGTEQE